VLLQVPESVVEQWSEGRRVGATAGRFSYSLEAGAYNDFSFSFGVPDDGWLVARQLWDRCWKVEIDGRPVDPLRADFAGMAVPVTRGTHRLAMEFRPLARALYQPASLALELLLLLLGAAAVSTERGRRGGRPAPDAGTQPS
jgi:hypothetical protein